MKFKEATYHVEVMDYEKRGKEVVKIKHKESFYGRPKRNKYGQLVTPIEGKVIVGIRKVV